MNWFVELPSETQLGVLAVVAALVDLGVTALIAYVPWLAFLEAYKAEWGMLAGAAVLAFLENLLPGGEWAAVSVIAVQLVLAIISAVGMAKKFLAKRGATKLLPSKTE